MTKFAEWAKSDLSQQTVAICGCIYLAIMVTSLHSILISGPCAPPVGGGRRGIRGALLPKREAHVIASAPGAKNPS